MVVVSIPIIKNEQQPDFGFNKNSGASIVNLFTGATNSIPQVS